MACPKCRCKLTYQYDDGCDGEYGHEALDRCAACGHIFYTEDELHENDEDETPNAEFTGGPPGPSGGICGSTPTKED